MSPEYTNTDASGPGDIPNTFFPQTNPQVNVLAGSGLWVTLSWEILDKIFNKRRPAPAVATPAQPTAGQAGAPSAFTTAHPDKTFMASGGGFGIKSGRNFVKTRNFNMGIQGIDVGDVDGDGAMEVLLANKSEVQVFDRDETRLNSIGTIKVSGYQIHNVIIADLDGDGKAEIYISASDPQIPGSMAVEWDGKQFATLFDNARWYIRPMDIPGTGPMLVGQAAGLVPVVEGVYALALNNGSLSRQERLPLPAKVNLFNFAYADLDGDDKKEVVALDESFKLQVIRGGSVSWKSEERFCGTKRYIGGDPRMMPGTNPTRHPEVDGVGELYKETFIPSRKGIGPPRQDRSPPGVRQQPGRTGPERRDDDPGLRPEGQAAGKCPPEPGRHQHQLRRRRDSLGLVADLRGGGPFGGPACRRADAGQVAWLGLRGPQPESRPDGACPVTGMGRFKHEAVCIDPRTGVPAETDWLSVSVIAPHAALTEGYAKALLIGGSREAERIVARRPEITYLAVDQTGQLWGSAQAGEVNHVVGFEYA